MEESCNKAIEVRSKTVKEPRWCEKKSEYICQHCGENVSTNCVTFGYECDKCGLPIHAR